MPRKPTFGYVWNSLQKFALHWALSLQTRVIVGWEGLLKGNPFRFLWRGWLIKRTAFCTNRSQHISFSMAGTCKVPVLFMYSALTVEWKSWNVLNSKQIQVFQSIFYENNYPEFLFGINCAIIGTIVRNTEFWGSSPDPGNSFYPKYWQEVYRHWI